MRPVNGRVEQVAQTTILTDLCKRTVTVRDRSAVAPDDRRTKHLSGGIHTHQAVHLIRDTDRLDVLRRRTGLLQRQPGRPLRVVVPRGRILFREPRLRGGDRHLGVRKHRAAGAAPRVDVE
jgi:hypothetical protein